MNKFEAPTVEGIDFPSLGITQAWNDAASGTLYLATFATTPDRRGVETSWRVTNLPNPDDVFVLCDGEPFERFEVEGSDSIRVDATIDSRQYQIFTGYRGEASSANNAQSRPRGGSAVARLALAQRSTGENANRVRSATSELFPSGGPTRAGCC